MHGVFEERLVKARKTDRNIVQGTATLCRGYAFALAWKGIFKFKAAEELAERSGQSLRTCSYQLSGEIEPTAASLEALFVIARRKL